MQFIGGHKPFMVMQEKNNQICDFTKMSFQLDDKKGFQEDK